MPEEQLAPVLEVANISVHRGRRLALDRVSLRAEGGVVALVGANGAGKSSLLRAISGSLPLSGGMVRIDERTMSARLRQRTCGYLPQTPQLNPRLTSLDFIRYCAWLRGCTSKTATIMAEDALRRVHLLDRRVDKVGELSGGMQRRLAIAAVLCGEPRVLLLDEPMAALDPQQRAEMRALIADIATGVTVVLATHVMQDVPSLTRRIVALKDGTIRFDGDVEQFVGTSDTSLEALEASFIRIAGESGS